MTETFCADFYGFSDEVVYARDRTFIRFDSIDAHAFKASMDLKDFNVIDHNPIQIEVDIQGNRFFDSEGRRISLGRWYKISTSAPRYGDRVILGSCYEAVPKLENNREPEKVKIDNIEFLSRRTQLVKDLEKTFSLDIFESTNIGEIENQCLQSFDANEICVIAYNVGQGSCAVLCDCKTGVNIYFDVGGGFGRNKGTYPSDLVFCHPANAIVVLSHWDMDHWISAKLHPHLCSLTWIVPDQKPLGVSHIQLAATIKKNGNLLKWSEPGTFNKGIISLTKLPSHTDRNLSGILACLRPKKTESVLIPGDAPYKKLPKNNEKYKTIIVPHHGGHFIGDIPPKAPRSHKIIYSYGNPNSYSHPSHITEIAHFKKGWTNRSDTIYGNVWAYPLSESDRSIWCKRPCYKKLRI